MTRRFWCTRGSVCPPTLGRGLREWIGATVAQIVSRVGVEVFLGQIRDSLKSGGFEPVEVRRVMIPKASGKVRKLGIPTVADRVVQASLKAVLEPIFEADFQPCSYGFRPHRRAQDAIAEIHFLASHFHEWVLEADIQACFDEIGHTPLLAQLRHKITDKRVLALGEGVLEIGGHDDLRGSRGDADRHATGRDSLPAAGEHRAIGVG
jgi:RNA-directed DNA polymerase